MDTGAQSVRLEYSAEEEVVAGLGGPAANDTAMTMHDRRIAETARFILKEKTRAEHEATEAAFDRYDLTRADHYRCFLIAHASALPRLELGATGKGWKGWHPRLPMISDDLAALGATLPVPVIAPSISDVAAWGVQYVLEGSRLGGRVLAARVPEGMPTRYLRPAPDMAIRWQAFCASLDSAALSGGEAWMDEVVDAAIETFRVFRLCAETVAEDLA